MAFFWFRLATWSPRPLSEAALYLYSLAVQRTGLPLITPFLAVMWSAVIGAAIVAAWRVSRSARPYWIAMSASIVAMFLLAPEIMEMFYWPFAAAAYLLTIAALLLAAFWIAAGRTATPRGQWAVCGALTLAILSVESGMFVAIGFALAAFALDLWLSPSRGGWRWLTGGAWYLLPLLPCVAIVTFSFMFRVADPHANISGTDAYFHRLIPGVFRAIHVAAHEATWGAAPRGAPSLRVSLVVEVLMFAGCFGCLSRAPEATPPVRHLVAFVAGLICTMFLTVLASLYQYGDWGFGRHRTFFHCVVILFLFVLARIAVTVRPMPARQAVWAGPICLGAALAIAAIPAWPALTRDYRLLPTIRAARWSTLESGNVRSVDTMRYQLPPAGRILGTSPWTPGVYSRTPDGPAIPWYASAVLDYFKKQTVEIAAGGTSSRSRVP
jgi:hypothetical protein